MSTPELHVVTGALGYSGKYIAERLIKAGHRVRTLTNSVQRPNPFGDGLEVWPYRFEDRDHLVRALEGATTFYNTYWVRFDAAGFSQSSAVTNTLRLFEAAKQAGVSRVVHVSITNPSLASPLPYFRDKAQLEQALIESKLCYAILRPAVLFGHEDVLVNNIAWTLRRLPVFGIFGDGEYQLQPIYVEDFATLAVDYGRGRDSAIVDAIGPETFTYRQLVRTIGEAIGKPRPILSVPPPLGLLSAKLMGIVVGDVVVTRDEIKGLMANLLCTQSPPAGTTRLSEWAKEHADTLGRHYSSELARRKNRSTAYERL